jgi:CrcB protein
MMIKLICVLIGGALGTGCRYGLSLFVQSLSSSQNADGKTPFPYATFLINVSGSFVIGLLAELFDSKVPVSPVVRAALLTGVLGGYTTFSSFSLETLALLRDGSWLPAFINAVGSVLLGLLAVWLGVRLAQML